MTGRILVAVDGSEHAMRAIGEAARLAKATGAELTLAHAVGPSYAQELIAASAGVPVEQTVIDALEKAREEQTRRILAAAVEAAQKAGGEAKGLAVQGAPAEAIVELAKAADVNLVVIGARGHGAIARLLLGSVADRITRLCPKPVLVVP